MNMLLWSALGVSALLAMLAVWLSVHDGSDVSTTRSLGAT